MGQQQLLLIVLGVIIVGVAVVVGIQMFTSSAEESNIDQTSNELLRVVARAQQHYQKPTAMGGGGKTFTGFVIPATIDTTESAFYAINANNAQSITFIATCRTATGVTIQAVGYPTTNSMVVNRP